MKLKQLAGLVSIALASVAAQANVVTNSSGLLTTYFEDFNNNSTSFSGGLYNALGTTDDYLWLSSPLGTPTSTFSFTTTSTSDSVDISFYYAALSVNATVGLFNPYMSLGNTPVAGFLLNNPGPSSGNFVKDADSFATYSVQNLAAGTYTLAFSSGIGGLKVDDVRIAVTAVPEPESYAMMLAGLGLMGAIARRRKAKQA